MKRCTCEDCGEPIHWVEMHDGELMAVDVGSGQQRVSCTREGTRGRVDITYRAHVATCKKTDDVT